MRVAADGAAVECIVTAGLHHPNVVQTLAHAVTTSMAHKRAAWLQRPPQDSPRVFAEAATAIPREMWIVMEYCDCGSLVVS